MPHATPLVQPAPGMPAAIYLRVSTTKQKEQGYSLDTQLPACLSYAKQYQFPVQEHHIFVDDMTGTTTDRPGIRDLRDLVHQQAIKLVIVYKIDRFMRDFAYQLMMIKEFSRFGVQVLDTTCPPMAPTPERVLLQHMLGAIAQFEHDLILERTSDGRRRRAEAGIPSARSPFGYRYVTTGKKTGHYEIDPEEAAIVLQIFHWYAIEGWPLYQIAARLNRAQVPTPQMRRGMQHYGPVPRRFWQTSTIHHILRNKDYLGTQHYGKTMNIPSPRNPKKTVKQATDEATWTPIIIPALVPRELFEAVAQRLAINALQNPRQRKRDYLLIGGRLRCEVCGYRMSGTTTRNTRYYRCFHAYKQEPRVGCRVLRADKVEPQVWESICHLAQHPEELTMLLDAYRTTVGPAQIAEDRTTLQQDLNKTQRALGKLLDLYLNPDDDDPVPMSKAVYQGKKKALDQEAALYQAQLTALDAQEQALADKATDRADLAEVLEVVNELLDEATTIPAKQRILDMLGVTVFYTPAKQFRLELAPRKRRAVVAPTGVTDSNASAHVGICHTLPEGVLLAWTLAA